MASSNSLRTNGGLFWIANPPVDVVVWPLRCAEAFECAAVPVHGVTSVLPGSGDISPAFSDRSLGSSDCPAAVLERRQKRKAASGICLSLSVSACMLYPLPYTLNVKDEAVLNEYHSFLK